MQICAGIAVSINLYKNKNENCHSFVFRKRSFALLSGIWIKSAPHDFAGHFLVNFIVCKTIGANKGIL